MGITLGYILGARVPFIPAAFDDYGVYRFP